jgi:SOS-response transcriptional repressor LexA
MQELTVKQQQIYDYLETYISEHSCPPTLREISEHIGIRGTSTAMQHLEALERKGYIQRREGSRGISLTRKAGGSMSVPNGASLRVFCTVSVPMWDLFHFMPR